jgi:hypothetical protein
VKTSLTYPGFDAVSIPWHQGLSLADCPEAVDGDVLLMCLGGPGGFSSN